MSTFIPTLPGADNALVANADEALNTANYLTRFQNIVYAVYKSKIVFANMVKRQVLGKGAKSGEFAFTGTKDAKFLGRAEVATGSAMKYTKTQISLDDIMYSDSFIADVDEHQSYLDVMTTNATADGTAIAKELDIQISIMVNKSATMNFPVENNDGSLRDGGTEIVLATAGDELDANKLLAAFKLAAQTLDEKDVPSDGRHLVVKPATFYALLDADKLINSDFSSGNGDYAKATLKGVAGLTIHTSNLMADYDPSVKFPGKYTGLQAKYNHNCDRTIALVFNADSVALLMARAMKIEKFREPKAQGEFIITTIYKGIGPLNPTGSVRILKAV